MANDNEKENPKRSDMHRPDEELMGKHFESAYIKRKEN